MNKKIFKEKIIIGTANFTQNYGSDLIKVNKDEIKKILNKAEKNGIKKIDTASNYLKNTNVFQLIGKNFKINSKIMPNSKWVSLENCEKELHNHFKNINRKKIETLHFHDTKVLYSKNGKKIFQNLQILKKKKLFKKIGISIYEVGCLNYLIEKYDFDVVQCPYNILDNRILSSGWFEKLKKNKIEIHARSLFLQGLLVNKHIYKKKYFKKWRNFFNTWFYYLDINKISPINYCLTDLLNYEFDNIIIGINSAKDFNEILNFKIINKKKMKNFSISDKKLIDPRNWK